MGSLSSDRFWSDSRWAAMNRFPVVWMSLAALNEIYQCSLLVRWEKRAESHGKMSDSLWYLSIMVFFKSTTGMSERKHRPTWTCVLDCTAVQSSGGYLVRNVGSTTSGPQMSLWPTRWRREGYPGKNLGVPGKVLKIQCSITCVTITSGLPC